MSTETCIGRILFVPSVPLHRAKVRHARCLHHDRSRVFRAQISGPALLAASTSIGLLSTRSRLIPAGFRGAPISFVVAAVLRWFNPAAEVPRIVFSYAPAAVACLLLTSTSGLQAVPSGSDSSMTMKPNRDIVLAFAVGLLGTVCGAIISTVLFPAFCHVSMALCASYIGGTLNLVQMVSAVGLESSPWVGTALSADLIFMVAYFGLLFAAASNVKRTAGNRTPVTSQPSSSYSSWTDSSVGPFMGKVLVCTLVIFLAFLIHSLAALLSRSVTFVGGIDTLLVTFFAFVTNRLFRVGFLSRGALVADIALLVFFSALGGSVQLTASMVSGAVPIFLVCLITLLCHGLFMLLAYFILRLPLPEILVSSNALIGGSSTAAFFAGSQGWSHLLGPAITIGSFGYGIGTPIALLLLKFLNYFVL